MTILKGCQDFELYKKQDGSAFYDNVRVLERKGHFDTCTQGHVLYKNDKNILDRSTDKNLSGASNEYIYYCNGGGVKNLTVFLFSSLEETTITDITLQLQEPDIINQQVIIQEMI